MITGVSKVVIEVEDQDRAKTFWTEKLGFSLVQDAPYGEERWVEVQTPEYCTNLVLELRAKEAPREAMTPEELPTSNVIFRCQDLKATDEELASRGVVSSSRPWSNPFGQWSMFDDSEGNRFALEQAAPTAARGYPDEGGRPAMTDEGAMGEANRHPIEGGTQ